MYPLEMSLLTLFAIANITVSLFGFYQCLKKNNGFGETWYLYPLGMYVWGDATVFGLFWAGAALASIWWGDLILFFFNRFSFLARSKYWRDYILAQPTIFNYRAI